jgi:hypothetical protein
LGREEKKIPRRGAEGAEGRGNRDECVVQADADVTASCAAADSATTEPPRSYILPLAQPPAGAAGFMGVRFGNVLGSRGSILPLFQKQIERGGPVTLTDDNMRRYFMTIPEACSLVLKAGGVGENGNLYILDMGEPVRIRDMAEQMIRFYGYEPEVDIKIETIGLRAGERLEESLWAEDEFPVDTRFSRIRRIQQITAAGGPAAPAGSGAGGSKDNIGTAAVGDGQGGQAGGGGAFPDGALDALLDKLRPICKFDPGNAALYRDARLLRRILKSAVPGLVIPEESHD